MCLYVNTTYTFYAAQAKGVHPQWAQKSDCHVQSGETVWEKQLKTLLVCGCELFKASMTKLFSTRTYTTQKKVKDICQYLDLNTKIKANSRNSTKYLENFKISLTFFCSVGDAVSCRWIHC